MFFYDRAIPHNNQNTTKMAHYANALNAKAPTVVIRRVHNKYTKQDIKTVFDGVFGTGAALIQCGISCVKSIKMSGRTDRKTGERYSFVTVEFSDVIPTSPIIRDFTDRINRNEEVKFLNILGTKYFWKVSKFVPREKHASEGKDDKSVQADLRPRRQIAYEELVRLGKTPEQYVKMFPDGRETTSRRTAGGWNTHPTLQELGKAGSSKKHRTLQESASWYQSDDEE